MYGFYAKLPPFLSMVTQHIIRKLRGCPALCHEDLGINVSYLLFRSQAPVAITDKAILA